MSYLVVLYSRMKSEDAVIFKGTKEGLWLILDDTVEYSDLREKLREKLRENADFFSGAKVMVNPGKRILQPNQYHEISDILQKEFGLILQRWDINEKVGVPKTETNHLQGISCEYCRGIEPLVVYRTVRSGQQIKHDGSVLVLGDVNPGAEIMAGGDITVLGVCRGTAHAGVSHNRNASVAAYRLQPTQLRIADILACAPDGVNIPTCPEIARIRDGVVVIEPANLR
jgi:septum site-determining protein MinC